MLRCGVKARQGDLLGEVLLAHKLAGLNQHTSWDGARNAQSILWISTMKVASDFVLKTIDAISNGSMVSHSAAPDCWLRVYATRVR
jgi:hypothetical protein